MGTSTRASTSTSDIDSVPKKQGFSREATFVESRFLSCGRYCRADFYWHFFFCASFRPPAPRQRLLPASLVRGTLRVFAPSGLNRLPPSGEAMLKWRFSSLGFLTVPPMLLSLRVRTYTWKQIYSRETRFSFDMASCEERVLRVKELAFFLGFPHTPECTCVFWQEEGS